VADGQQLEHPRVFLNSYRFLSLLPRPRDSVIAIAAEAALDEAPSPICSSASF
jgi:hypothetical protein